MTFLNPFKPYVKAIVAAVSPIILNGIAEFGGIAVDWASAVALGALTALVVWASPNKENVE